MANKETVKEAMKLGDFNPYEVFYKVMDKQIERVDAMCDEMDRRQVQAVEQTNRAIGELTKMAQDSILFSSQMSQEIIKTARGTTRWASEIVGSWAR